MKCVDTLNETAIQHFRDYLRIPTVHPKINFDCCIEFLKNYAKELDLPVDVYEFVPCQPIVIITWQGTDPNAPSILLNSHADVVPVTEEKWSHPPFAAEMDNKGNIFARGAQDMKCVPIMYLEAIRRLICRGIRFRRSFYLTFMPDEEVGGKSGMGTFVTTEEFKNLNVGFALDEGFCSPLKSYGVIYGENICWQVEVHVRGKSGHGCSLEKDTTAEKFLDIVHNFMEYRNKMVAEKAKCSKNPSTDSITVVNLTKLSGGSLPNVLPDELIATFDIRISIYQDLNEFEQMLNQWCCVSGCDVNLEYIMKEKKRPETNINCGTTNPFWSSIKSTADRLGLSLLPLISPGMTDSRYLREKNIPALGFTPINETEMTMHSDDEYVNKEKIIEGIKIYMELFISIGNL